MHSPLVTFCLSFRSFWLCLTVVVPMKVMKVITRVALNTFPNLQLIFNICKCLSTISYLLKLDIMLTKLELCFSALTHFYLTGLISLDCPLSTNPFTKSLERFLYLSKVQQTRFILNAWL